MTCPRHHNKDVGNEAGSEAGTQQADTGVAPTTRLVSDVGDGLATRWHRFWCARCRQETKAERVLERGVQQMRTEPVPVDGLARTLAALGLPGVQGMSAQARQELKAQLRRFVLLIGLGVFVTTLAQPEQIGQLSLDGRFNGHASVHTVSGSSLHHAALWLLLGLFWYLKPLVALLVERTSRRGVSRRVYIVFGALAAACLWLLLPALTAHAGSDFVATVVGVGAMLALVSTVMGGILIEQGQRMGATGRLGALHYSAIRAAEIGVGLLAGFLSGHAFRLTAAVSASLLVVLAGVSYTLLRERKRHAFAGAGEADRATLREDKRAVGKQSSVVFEARRPQSSLRALLSDRNILGVSVLMLVVQMAPNFTSLLKEQNHLLGFGGPFVSRLDAIGSACELLGALAYVLLCRRVPLQTLLKAGIVCNGLGTLLYLGYKSALTAQIIEGANGILAALVGVMLFDLAVRAIPRAQAMLGYALLMSLNNLAGKLSDVFGSWLHEHLALSFVQIVWLSALLCVPALFAVAFLPAALVERREGEVPGEVLPRERGRAGIPSYGL